MTNKGALLLFIILLIASLGQVSSDLYLPSLPSMAIYFNINSHFIQFTVAVYMIGFCLSQLVYGPWSDAVGRRVPLLTGLVINLAGGLICWLAPNIYFLLLGRLLQGLGVGAANALARPILRDLFEKEKLAIYNSYLALSSVLILSLAPLLGGYIQYYAGWRYNFLFLSMYGFFTLCLVFSKITETSQHHHKDNFKLKVLFKNAKSLLTNKVFMRFSLCALLTYAGILAWLTATPIILQEKMGLNAMQFGWLYIFTGFGFALGAILNINLVAHLGMHKMMQWGLYCQSFAGGFMLFFYLLGYFNVYVIVVPIIIFMMGTSMLFPNASASALTPFPKIAGMAGTLFGFMQILGGAISSSMISLLPNDNQFPLAIAFIVITSLSLFVFHAFRNTAKGADV